MSFHEDERIRRKNRDVSLEPVKSENKFELVLGSDCSLGEIVNALKEAGFDVSLHGTNTITVE